MGPFSGEPHKEIIGCLRQRYTCGWGLYIAARGEAAAVERRGRVSIVWAARSGNFIVASERPSDNPLQRPGMIRQRVGPHTHTRDTHFAQMHKHVLENWQSPSDNLRNKGEISGEWSHSHPAVHRSGPSAQSTIGLQLTLLWSLEQVITITVINSVLFQLTIYLRSNSVVSSILKCKCCCLLSLFTKEFKKYFPYREPFSLGTFWHWHSRK